MRSRMRAWPRARDRDNSLILPGAIPSAPKLKEKRDRRVGRREGAATKDSLVSSGAQRMDEGRSRRNLPLQRLHRSPPHGAAEGSGDAASPSRAPQPRLELAFILNESESDRVTRRPSHTLSRDRRDAASERRLATAYQFPLPVDLWRPPSPAEAVSQRRRAQPTSSLLEETKGRIDIATFDENEEKTAVPSSPPGSGTRALVQEPDIVAAPPVEMSREEKRKGRTCRVDGCDNYIVHKGLCCRHGGARKCTIEGCDSTAKYMGLCWKHGGSTWCKVTGCSKRAKAKGKCWAHGGGTQCRHVDCTKVAVSNGLCWAHGGGKRCLVDDCNRPGYERTNGFCDRHFEELQHTNYFEV